MGLLGAAGVTMLVGCGGEEKTGTSGPHDAHGGSGGSNGGGGNGGAGGTPPGTGGAGGGETPHSGGAGGADAGKAPAVDGGNQTACESKMESTVGPYPNIDPLERRDVRGNTTGTTTPKDGAALTLLIRVFDLDAACAPIPGAIVDVWHCDALGVYAGYAAFSTTGQDFCRGYQKTDAQGVAEFLTIFPGSYSGRAIHIHFSIQAAESKLVPNAEGGNVPGVFVAQFYFERTVADAIFTATPIYAQGAPITPNEADGIYSGEGGAGLVAKMTKSGSGYVGTIDVGVKRSDIGK